MHSEAMSMLVQEFLFDANGLQWKKNADYHPDRVAFLEIFRTCAETGISVEQDLWAKFRKQYIAIRSAFVDRNSESEPFVSRCMDVAVYAGMMNLWNAEKSQIVQGALQFVREQTQCENEYQPFAQGWGNCTSETTVKCDRCRLKFWLQRELASYAG